MENNNKPTFGVGGVIIGLGALGYAAYRLVKKKVELEKAKAVIEIQPEPPKEEKVEE